MAAAWLMILVVFGSMLVFGRDVLVPLAVAVLLWYLINAIATFFRRVVPFGRTRFGGWLARLLSALAIIGGILFVVQVVADSVAQVGSAAPAYQENLQAILPRLLEGLGIHQLPSVAQLMDQLNVAALIGQLTGALTALAGNAGLIAIYVIFLLLEQESFDKKIDALFPQPGRAEQARAMLAQVERRIEAYVRIKTFVSLLTASLCYLVLWTFGVDYQGFWALIVFLFNYIPNIGSFLAVLFPTALTLIQFGSPFTAVMVGLLLGSVQLVIGNMLEPRLMGRSLNLSPLVIIISLAFWGSVWGLAGMFLCVPLTMIFMIVCAHFEPTRPVAVLLSGDGQID